MAVDPDMVSFPSNRRFRDAEPNSGPRLTGLPNRGPTEREGRGVTPAEDGPANASYKVET